MPHYSTCGVIDCTDRPLSITGNVIGILTLAYAILITFVYCAKDLATAKDEMKIFNERTWRAQRSLVGARERLRTYFTTLRLPISQDIEILLTDAESWLLKYRKYRERFLGKIQSMPISLALGRPN